MHLFHDSTLNTWRLITEKLPEKPERGLLESHVGNSVKDRYDTAIAALKQNALTVANWPEVQAYFQSKKEGVMVDMIVNGELYFWKGGWTEVVKPKNYQPGEAWETKTVAILTLPEEKIEVHGTESGKLFIKPEDLFALPKVQETIKKAANRAEEKKNTMENLTKEQAIEF